MDGYDLPENDKQKLIQKYLSPTVPNSPMSFRIKGAKQLTGSKTGFQSMRNELLQIYNEIVGKIDTKIDDGEILKRQNPQKKQQDYSACVEFSSSTYLVRSEDGKCVLTLVRSNNLVDNLNVK